MIILQLKNSRKYINCNSLINYKDQGQGNLPQKKDSVKLFYTGKLVA